MSLGESRENYLKSIFILKNKKGAIRSVDLSHFMGYSKASISIALKKMCEEGYVRIEENGVLELTEVGKREAEVMYERHCFFEKKLLDLGISPERAHADACRLEHAISAESFEAVQRKAVQGG